MHIYIYNHPLFQSHLNGGVRVGFQDNENDVRRRVDPKEGEEILVRKKETENPIPKMR
jgi:hypothetical protein